MVLNKASIYPSILNVKCFFGTVQKVTATLHGLSHEFPDDMDILLVGPRGQAVKLMSDAGGNALSFLDNITLTFDQLAATPVPDSSQIVSGSYRPADYAPADTFPSPAPALTAANLTNLFGFNGTNANGIWSLYIVDDQTLDDGSLARGWSLNIDYQPSGPILSAPEMLSDGRFQFVLNAEPTLTHVIEASSDLENWVPISTNTVNGSTLIFIDFGNTNHYYRFYRAVRPQ